MFGSAPAASSSGGQPGGGGGGQRAAQYVGHKTRLLNFLSERAQLQVRPPSGQARPAHRSIHRKDLIKPSCH
eukprot:6298925-Pyramimonas_sp.AAC.1